MKEQNDKYIEDTKLILISDNKEEEGVDNRLREISPYLIDIDIEVTELELLETAT